MNIKDLMAKLEEIENRVDEPVMEVISAAEQQELTKLFLQLNDPRYASNQDVARELDRYNSVMRDVDKYATSTFQPGSDQVGMPEVPRQPMPGEKNPNYNKPLTGNQPAIMKMQKELKAAGADLGNYGSNKDGIDGNLGGKNSKTRQAMAKFPEIAKKYGFDPAAPSGQGAIADPNAQKPASGAAPMNDQAIAGTLFKSMSGVGTDSTMFINAITQIKTPQQFANVSKLYRTVAGEDLVAAIEDDFSGTELANIKRMYLSKFGVK